MALDLHLGIGELTTVELSLLAALLLGRVWLWRRRIEHVSSILKLGSVCVTCLGA